MQFDAYRTLKYLI